MNLVQYFCKVLQAQSHGQSQFGLWQKSFKCGWLFRKPDGNRLAVGVLYPKEEELTTIMTLPQAVVHATLVTALLMASLFIR